VINRRRSARQCGDGVKAASNRTGAAAEECDDQNKDDSDGCSSSCEIESGWACQGVGPESCAPVCGDAILAGGEQCDDKNTDGGDGCNAECEVESGWECIVGEECKTVCGDGVVVKPTESCDDHNTTPGDGCDSQCQVEEGWECAGLAGEACNPKCGDGIKLAAEDCDDGNMLDNDGCSASCTEEEAWDCDAEHNTQQGTTTCEKKCGNGKHEHNEGCDDGNRLSGDGCSAACAIEPDFYCVPFSGGADRCNAVVDCAVGEWDEWGPCTAECNGGHKLRPRSVVTEASPGGATCAALTESRECNTEGCIGVDCSLTEWSAFEECTLECGGGHQVRSRGVAEPAEYSGVSCGSLTEQRACNTQACPARVNCAVEEWTEWSSCTKPCDGGKSDRSRSIWQQPTSDGTPCPALSEERDCNTQGCPAQDCELAEWSAWGTCDKDCGSGTMSRNRTVTTPAAVGGIGCGELVDDRQCKTQPCALPNKDCRVGAWGLWSECSEECGGGSRSRQRVIIEQPQNAGATCGNLAENEECQSQQCPPDDCVMSAWSVFSECDKECGGGISERKRTILEEPSSNGLQCGSILEQRECSTQPCASNSTDSSESTTEIPDDGTTTNSSDTGTKPAADGKTNVESEISDVEEIPQMQ